MSGFGGIPAAAVEFYQDLEEDNSKPFWTANKHRYDEFVRGPMEALAGTLAGQFGPATLFRPYRDVRFAADKRPYKESQGALARVADSIGYYVQIGPDGLMTAGGFYAHSPDQVARLRAAVDADATGSALLRIVDDLAGAGFEIGGDRLKTRPRGVREDHPRLDLMRHRSLTASRHHGTPSWLSTRRAADRVRADWLAMRPLVEWLTDHVGSSTTPRRR